MKSTGGLFVLLFLAYFSNCCTAREVPSPPLIVKQPPTDEVLFQVEKNGENNIPFYIECEAEGEPAPKYYWMKNGKKFDWQAYDDRISQQPGSGTLAISRPAEVDIGQYQCFAQNEYGTATSNSVFMRKAELNSFKHAEPVNVQGLEGQPAGLTCEPPTGWPKPVVQWILLYPTRPLSSINSIRITLDPEGNLWFSNLTMKDASDGFMYACMATSVIQHEYKYGNRVLLNVVPSGVSATLNKVPPTQQYVSRKNEVGHRGKKVELFCIFGGTPLPQTVWYKHGKPIRSTDRITQGHFGKSLIIKVVDFEDKGTYSCEVSNGVGEMRSYSINLDVLAHPYFIEEPELKIAAENETVEFRCVAGGVPEPDIKWIFNGMPIEKAPKNDRRRIEHDRLVIERLTKNDTANYGCNATNSLGYIYKDVYVNVQALSPEITETPRDTDVVDNQSINLTCKVMGAPKPTIKWIHNGQELTGGKFKVQNSGDLLITDIQFSDRGNYTCFAKNKHGQASASAKLEVKAHTVITDGPEDFKVESGTRATFRCKAHTDESLDLDIIWLKHGEPIDYDADPRFVKSSDYSLIITKTIELDSGFYTCLARTELDEASASAQLIVQDVPDAPGNISVKCNTLDAIVHWISKRDKRAPISHYIIEYNTSFTPDTWAVASKKVLAVGDTSYTVPIYPWGNYTFRVIAVNKISKSLPSPHSEVCNTPPSVPHKNPDNVKGEGTAPDNLVISWNPMPQFEHAGPGFKYRVYYKRDIPGKDFDAPHEISDWTVKELLIPDQNSFQRYSIKVMAVNDIGEADVSPQVVTGYSGENVPLEAPKNFTTLSVLNGTTALFRWEPVALESVRGHFQGYKIRTWADEAPQNFNEIQVQGQMKKALVSNLVPFTQNYAQVYAFNKKYNGPPSETLSFRTPEGVPGDITMDPPIKLGQSAFILRWRKPTRPNGILTGYNIYYAQVDGTKSGVKIPRTPQINDPNRLTAKLAGLKPETKYRIFLTATTAAGESSPYLQEAETRSQRFMQPDKPSSFRWEPLRDPGKSASAVRVTWLPNERGNPGSHFYVKYKKRGESGYLKTPPEKNEDFSDVGGLENGETYEMIVVSVDGDYEIDSDPQEVDTNDSIIRVSSAKETVATAGWFIGMMLAIVFFLLVLIIVYIVKRGRRNYPEEGGNFLEYSQPSDTKSQGRASMSSEHKVGPESDTIPMAEWGSFIDRYRWRKGQGETTSQRLATLV